MAMSAFLRHFRPSTSTLIWKSRSMSCTRMPYSTVQRPGHLLPDFFVAPQLDLLAGDEVDGLVLGQRLHAARACADLPDLVVVLAEAVPLCGLPLLSCVRRAARRPRGAYPQADLRSKALAVLASIAG